jgi:hypothetical protein
MQMRGAINEWGTSARERDTRHSVQRIDSPDSDSNRESRGDDHRRPDRRKVLRGYPIWAASPRPIDLRQEETERGPICLTLFCFGK